jgi:hypothetical protein
LFAVRAAIAFRGREKRARVSRGKKTRIFSDFSIAAAAKKALPRRL